MSTTNDGTENFRKDSSLFGKICEQAGIALVVVAACILYFTFEPAIQEEVKYYVSSRDVAVVPITHEEAQKEEGVNAKTGEESALLPVDEDFGIVIPKITANAKVLPDVNWKDSAVYQRALTQGVAHAAGTALPGEEGNVFIFAHSGVDFYEANRYNAVFYLIGKLEAGDTIYLFYKGKRLEYKVVENKIVAAEAVEYLTGDAQKKTLTLMTCWPAGTTYKRLVVVAEEVTGI